MDHMVRSSWSWNQGQGGKGKGKGQQVVCSHCGCKGHSVDQCWWAPKTSSSGSGSDHQRQVYNISAQPGDSLRLHHAHRSAQRISRPCFISNNNLTIGLISHNDHLRQRCPRSWPLAKIKDSVVISLESTISRQAFQKTTSWRSTSTAPSMTSVLHCLRNVKNLGQHSSIQEQLHQLLLNHLFLTSPSRRNQRPSPVSMVGTSSSWVSSTLSSSQERSSLMSTSSFIVEDVKNPIIGLDAIHHNHLQVHLHGKGKCTHQQHQRKALLHYHQSHYYASGLVLPDHVQGHHLRWSDPQFSHNLR